MQYLSTLSAVFHHKFILFSFVGNFKCFVEKYLQEWELYITSKENKFNLLKHSVKKSLFEGLSNDIV